MFKVKLTKFVSISSFFTYIISMGEALKYVLQISHIYFYVKWSTLRMCTCCTVYSIALPIGLEIHYITAAI